jgi:hypothetical protein
LEKISKKKNVIITFKLKFSYGQLGDTTTTTSLKPIPVKNIGAYVLDISSFDEHTCQVISSISYCHQIPSLDPKVCSSHGYFFKKKKIK